MTSTSAIRWFKQTFGASLRQALAATPFSPDFLVAIACQETGYLWMRLLDKGVARDEILRLCVGDTIDGNGARGRQAFPRTRADLEKNARGAEMFAIARKALEDMANATGDRAYLAALRNPDKFCRGFGVFQYDLQHFDKDPAYFLEQRYANFDAALAHAIGELRAAKLRVYPDRTTLTDLEQVHVGIAYNAGRFDPKRGLKQGYKDSDGKYYGELLADWLKSAQAVADAAAPPVVAARGALPSAAPAVAAARGEPPSAAPTERFAVPGRSVAARSLGLDEDIARFGDSELDEEDIVAVDVGSLSRASGDKVEIDLARDELVAVKLAGGATLWFTPEDFLDWKCISISPPREGSLRLLTPVASGSREGGWLIKGLAVVRRTLLDRLFAGAGNLAERALVEHLESKLLRPDTLFSVDPDADSGGMLQPLSAPKANGRWLLFLHGTQSSSDGSFSALWRSATFRRGMSAAGFDGILAFEHRTLSESPARNIEALAAQLPAGARLVVVGYSRGGLVGDLLARACPREGRPGLDADDLERYRRCCEAEADVVDGAAEVAALDNAVRLLRDRNIAVEWLIPVGAPLAGTTLASGKLSRLLSQLLNLAAASRVAAVVHDIAGSASVGGAVLGVLTQLLAATARDLIDFRDVPGLQAMNPGGALVTWLGERRGPEFVGALKSKASSDGWRVLVSFALDRVFERDNDWVVDTASMVPVARDEDTGDTATTFALDVSGAGIYHLTYFDSDRVQRVLTQMLASSADSRRDRLAKLGFQPVLPEARAELAQRAALPADAPILFVLPGIMGTELKVGSDRIWLDKPQLFFGGMEKLGIAANVSSGKPLDEGYRDLIAYFETTHEVIPFGYDWRLSLTDAATRLNARVRETVARAGNRPISFLAHSMGGLVVRTMMTLPDSAWPDVARHPKSRFLMLGTPNGGSHAISQILTGEESLLKLLALGSSSLRDIVGLCAAFPGILDMLPEFTDDTQTTPNDKYFELATWQGLWASTGTTLPLPTETAFERAKALRRVLRQQVLPPERVFYVAGKRDETPVDVVPETGWFGRKRIAFTKTSDGDGRVTWTQGIPSGVRHWYVDAIHGDLSSDRGLFSGYSDILGGGMPVNRRFSDRPLASATRVARGGDRGIGEVRLLRRDAACLPARGDLAAAALGGTVGGPDGDVAAPKIKVTVTCGDARSARYPVLVGHYRDDGLYSAEAALNAVLEQALQRSLDVGTHPGEIGQHKIFELALGGGRRRRAVVVGLGEFGLLSTGRLVETLATAVTGWIEAQLQDGVTRPANLSAVQIGTGTGGVGVEPALQALLEAVIGATDRFAGECTAAWPLEIEIIELYSDRAHRAWHTLDRLIRRSPRLDERFALAPRLRFAGTGRRRAYYEEDASWAQRVRIGGKRDRRGGHLRSLDFEVFSALARVSAQQVGINHQMTQSLIDSASSLGPESPDVSVALYHLLVPREIKQAHPNGERLVLIVDRVAAGIPWELLRPALHGTGSEPLSVQGSMIRQLSLPEPVMPLRRVRNGRALVIGDPKIGPEWSNYFAPLDGARREAQEVKRLLAGQGYAVNADEPRTTREVTVALHREPCQILHIAAHGVFEWLAPFAAAGTSTGSSRPERWTGAVLENGTFRPSDVAKLPAIPELVFINCCHLGRIGGVATDFPQLAANLAQSFIALGARAVVAAGWAVNDGAALLFAQTFYASLLGGAPFVAAVREARDRVYRMFPDDNTWGAYQCYGSDSYMLVDTARGQDEAPAADVPACSVHDLVLSVIAPAAEVVRRATDDRVEDIIADLHRRLRPMYGDAVGEEFRLAAIPATAESCTTLPAAVHVALCGFYWNAGAFEQAARHAESAWLRDVYRVSTQMLTRSAAAASRAALLCDDIGACVALSRRASAALATMQQLPPTVKRLTTIAGVLRRHAMIEPTKSAIDAALAAYGTLIDTALARLGSPNTTGASPILAWSTALAAARGAARQRLRRLENVVNQRAILLLVLHCKGHTGQCAMELTEYAQLSCRPLRRGRFWRISACADRLMLRTILAALLAPAGGTPLANAPERYVRMLRDALVADPGRDRISSVRETLVSLQWFLPGNTPAGKLLEQFRQAFERLPR